MQEKLLIVGIIALVVISGCATQKPKTIQEVNVCGDGVCGATEDCNTCIKDCGCSSDKYCDSIGVCKVPVCGDDICSTVENQSQTCCDDCGCITDSVCNRVTQTCQGKTAISDDALRVVATAYMRANNIIGNITTILDTYYQNQTVKQVNINCKTVDMPYPCAVYLYIDASGKVVDSVRTT